jgi:hypothetical protein
MKRLAMDDCSWRRGKAVEGHRTPGRWRESRGLPNGAKRPGVRQPSGASRRGRILFWTVGGRAPAPGLLGSGSFPVVPWGRTPCQNHFAMDDWGNGRLNFLSREGREVRRTGIFVETAA